MSLSMFLAGGLGLGDEPRGSVGSDHLTRRDLTAARSTA